MVRLTCTQINLLGLVLVFLYSVQAEGSTNNQTWLIGLHQNATNGSQTVVPWVRRVRHQQAPGCWGRPWICNQGGFPSRVRRRCCGNRCVEVTSDVNNCGVCGIRCPFTWQCCRGVCVDTNVNPFNCGRCFNRCPFFTFCTYGMCGYAGPSPPFPFPPRPPKPPFPFPPKPPKPPRGPELPEPPQSQTFPDISPPPLGDGPSPPDDGRQPPPFDGQPPQELGAPPISDGQPLPEHDQDVYP